MDKEILSPPVEKMPSLPNGSDVIVKPAVLDKMPSVEKRESIPGVDAITAEKIKNPPNPSVSVSEVVKQNDMSSILQRNFFRFRKKVFKIFGGSYDLYDEDDRKILYAHQKEFKLREDFRVYEDATRKNELLKIKTENIIDDWATYHISDSQSNQEVGSIKRNWLRSAFRDKWTYYSPSGEEIGIIEESSWKRAIASRIFGFFCPQKYFVLDKGRNKAAEVNQHFNPFVLKYDMRILMKDPTIDRRLLVATGILLAGIEGRQVSGSSNQSSLEVSIPVTTPATA